MPKGYVLKTNAHGIFFDGARCDLRADVVASCDLAVTCDTWDCGAHSNLMEDADQTYCSGTEINFMTPSHYYTTSPYHYFTSPLTTPPIRNAIPPRRQHHHH